MALSRADPLVEEEDITAANASIRAWRFIGVWVVAVVVRGIYVSRATALCAFCRRRCICITIRAM